MAALLFTLIAVLVVGIGARDQMLLAAMTTRPGARAVPLVSVAAASALASVTVAAWASQIVAAAIPAPARLLFAAIALGLAGLEMLFTRRQAAPREPTQSLGAFAVVLLARQLTDASRFVVLAIAVATRAPLPAALGGAAAALALVAVGWLGGEELARAAVPRARRLLGAALVVGAALLGLKALALI